VETNTFNSTAISQSDYGTESLVPELNAAGGRRRGGRRQGQALARPRPRFVAGAIGPLNRTLSMSPDVNRPDFRAVTWDQVVGAYLEQARALAPRASTRS
jgi:5-methyltetrahydrofolate--homocysteine methyltransferase